MTSIVKIIKKIATGLAIAAFAVTVAAATNTKGNNSNLNEMVGHFGDDDWRIIDPNGQFESWDCESSPNESCTGVLKNESDPLKESYTDEEVDFSDQNQKFIDLT